MLIAITASQLILSVSGLAIAAAYAKVRSRMGHRLDSLALLLLLPLRGE
jgi:hypothetical protein